MGAVPELGREGVAVGGEDGLDAVDHDAEGLVGPEVAAGVGEVVVFEEEGVAVGGGEDEIWLVVGRGRG